VKKTKGKKGKMKRNEVEESVLSDVGARLLTLEELRCLLLIQIFKCDRFSGNGA